MSYECSILPFLTCRFYIIHQSTFLIQITYCYLVWYYTMVGVFVYPSYYMGLYHPNIVLALGWIYLDLKVFAWCINLNGIINKNILKYKYHGNVHK